MAILLGICKVLNRANWIVKELLLSNHLGETILFTIYIYIYVPMMAPYFKFRSSNPVKGLGALWIELFLLLLLVQNRGMDPYRSPYISFNTIV